MGKKSKRKSNNKQPTCYHGCTKKEFNNCGEHYTVLESYDNNVDVMEFFKTHKQYMVNSTFGRFVIAHVTADYLKGKDDATLRRHLRLLLHSRYLCIPHDEGKDIGPESEITRNMNKYMRDIATERGRINCIVREIPCNCMEEKRIEAQSMEKVAVCYGCGNEFPKKKMLRCKGCDHAQYCSKKCSIKAWPTHKEFCDNIRGSSAPTPTPASLPSFGETIDADAEEE